MFELTLAAKIALLASGYLLLVGMLTGVWKYVEIRRSARFRAHYYVDIAHRASLMYASACLILAALAQFSVWSDSVNIALVLGNVVFFVAAILGYVFHGIMKDTTNQMRIPHQMGKWTLPSVLMTLFMVSLSVAEVGCTLLLCVGATKGLLH